MPLMISRNRCLSSELPPRSFKSPSRFSCSALTFFGSGGIKVLRLKTRWVEISRGEVSVKVFGMSIKTFRQDLQDFVRICRMGLVNLEKSCKYCLSCLGNQIRIGMTTYLYS